MITSAQLKAARKAFEKQVRCTTRRVDRNGDPIEFRLTFEQWLQVWLESGQLENRGVKAGQYVMARKGPDIGHYELGNVEIKLSSENAGDGKRGRPFSCKTPIKFSRSAGQRSVASKMGRPTDEARVE